MSFLDVCPHCGGLLPAPEPIRYRTSKLLHVDFEKRRLAQFGDLPVRVGNQLLRSGYTRAELDALPDEELDKLHNIGAIGAEEIRKARAIALHGQTC